MSPRKNSRELSRKDVSGTSSFDSLSIHKLDGYTEQSQPTKEKYPPLLKQKFPSRLRLRSLGSGYIHITGDGISFVPSSEGILLFNRKTHKTKPTKTFTFRNNNNTINDHGTIDEYKFAESPTEGEGESESESASSTLLSDDESDDFSCVDLVVKPTLYMRATDFQDLEGTTAPGGNSNNINNSYWENQKTLHPHIVRPSPNTNLDSNINELWIAVNLNATSDDAPTPVLSHMIRELSQKSLDFVTNSIHWTPVLSSNRFAPYPPPNNPENFSQMKLSPSEITNLQSNVLLWSSNAKSPFTSQSHTVTIRAMAIIHMPPKDLFDLMLDSQRVKEYNQYSMGRKDIWEYRHDADSDKGTDKDAIVTKVVHGKNKPPLIRKHIPYMTLFHGRKYKQDNDSEEGYALITRTVRLVDEHGIWTDGKSYSSEIRLGANLILPVQGHDGMSLFVNANHVKGPMPSMISKKVGLAGAASFINGLRSLT